MHNENKNIFTGNDFTKGESIEQNKKTLGVVSIDNPDIINLYPSSFENKNNFKCN